MKLSGNHWNEDAWQRVTKTLFHPRTGLVYDYVTSCDHAKRFDHLPTPAEIEQGFPNPCGWGTGMEDCALNGGFLLDLLRLRGETDSSFAVHAAYGLISCAAVHGTSGFVARGISPRDGRSCYSNSSRDQFTLAVYGMWRFLTADGRRPAELHRSGIAFLRAVAGYCEHQVTPEHDYDLGRLDGGRAVVSRMWRNDPHEALRLPMIYGAAATLTRDPHLLELMNRYLNIGLDQTLQLDPDGDWWDMPLIQMQLSLNFFRESRIQPRLEPELRQAMHLASVIALRLLPPLLTEAEEYSGSWNVPYDNWRTLPMRLREETISEHGQNAIFDRKTYLNPQFRSAYSRPNELLRGIGNLLAVLALSPALPPELPGLLQRTEVLLERLYLSEFSGVGLVPLLYGTLSAQTKTSTIQPQGVLS